MNKKKSGPAILIDIIIMISVGVCVVCFGVHYTNIYPSNCLLWTGIAAFTILYQLGLRLEFGVVTSKHKHKLKNDSFLFKERNFESRLYNILKVKRWKNKALTYDPLAFSLKEHTKEEVLQTMLKSELDHWINELISVSTLLFGLIWGNMWIFVIVCIVCMLFDAQFICIQRYNRPRILRIIEKERRKEA